MAHRQHPKSIEDFAVFPLFVMIDLDDIKKDVVNFDLTALQNEISKVLPIGSFRFRPIAMGSYLLVITNSSDMLATRYLVMEAVHTYRVSAQSHAT